MRRYVVLGTGKVLCHLLELRGYMGAVFWASSVFLFPFVRCTEVRPHMLMEMCLIIVMMLGLN